MPENLYLNTGTQSNSFKLSVDEASYVQENWEAIAETKEKIFLREFFLKAVKKALANKTQSPDTATQSATENQRVNELENQLRIANQTAADLREQLTELENRVNSPDTDPENSVNNELLERIAELEATANENGEIATRLQQENEDLKADNAIMQERLSKNPATPVNTGENQRLLQLTPKEDFILNAVCERLKTDAKTVLIDKMFMPFIYKGPQDFYKIPFSQSALEQVDNHYKINS